MALTFAITPSGSSPVIFKDLADATFAGRGALDWNESNPQYDTPAYNIPGVDGNLRLRKGLVGGDVMLTCRYFGVAATVDAYWIADKLAFANKSCSLTDGTNTYSRCELVSATRLGPEKGTKDGKYLFDVMYRFTRDI